MADSTAYNKHDLEDGLYAGMFSEETLTEEVELWRRSSERVEARYPGFLTQSADRKLRIQRIANELIGEAIKDLLQASKARIDAAGVQTAAEVQAHGSLLISHSPDFEKQVAELSSFLYKRFYRHEHLQRYLEFSRSVLAGLFRAYLDQPREMPRWYQDWSEEQGLHRSVCDFLGGMTDRFALKEYKRLAGPLPGGLPSAQPRNRPQLGGRFWPLRRRFWVWPRGGT